MNIYSHYSQPLGSPGKIPAAQRKPAIPRFSGAKKAEQMNAEELARDAVQRFSGQIEKTDALQAIQNRKPLTLKDGTKVLYGTLDGKQVNSPFSKAEQLVTAAITGNNHSGSSTKTAFFVPLQSKSSEAALKTLISDLLPTHLKASYTDTKTRLESTNVIYTDLIENLVSGNLNALPDIGDKGAPGLKTALREAFRGGSVQTGQGSSKTLDFRPLGNTYTIQTTNESLNRQLNNPNSAKFRSQLFGLDLARKIYSEGQEVEWESIALSLGLGGIAEPTVSHMFKDGGPVASGIRTGMLSGVDIAGNVLSVMGVVSEKLKAKGQKLSIDSIFGPKEQRNKNGLWKNMTDPQGSAGPDLKQGVKVGVGGGMFGVLYNIPVGMLLSQPNGDVLPRAIVGGLSSTGSAVAIPAVIKSSKEGFKKNIEELIAKDKIAGPKKGEKGHDQFVEKLIRKEMNTRIGYASSIKATNPIPLLGTGAMILGAEKLGIPREYVQTAYMALAPVMHNFVRLLYTGLEKWHTIPRRINKLENLVLQSNGKRITSKDLDNAMLDREGDWMIRFLTNTAGVALTGTVLLAAELMVFKQAFQKNKAALQDSKPDADKPAAGKPPIHFRLQSTPHVGLHEAVPEFGDRPNPGAPYTHLTGYVGAPPAPFNTPTAYGWPQQPAPTFSPLIAPMAPYPPPVAFQPRSNAFQPMPYWNNSAFNQQR